MITAQAGLQGGTPQMAVSALDPQREACGKPVENDPAQRPCARGKGHYGACGVAEKDVQA